MPEKSRYSRYEPLFGSWYIRNRIGKGAIGEVFEIEREDMGTTYKAALKAITIPDDPDDIKRVLSSGVAREDLPDYFRNLVSSIAGEYQYLAKLKGNSHIVNYEDHQIIENPDEMRWDILIKTELLTPLVEYSIAHPLDESDVLKLGVDICRALVFCGRYGIIHRDIKPENILIAPSGDYKLGDFGIARVVEETQMSLSRKGTYTYMAPEVFRGESYGSSADLYSLGIVMYKYLNHGRVPFMPPYPQKISFDDSENAFSMRMSGRKLPDPDTGSARLRRIILKACAFNKYNRYQTAEEMLADLEELYTPQQVRRIRKKSRRTRKKETAAAAGDLSGTKSGSRLQKATIYALVLLICVLTAAGTYISIPKEVTNIAGISDTEIYYDAELEPEYTVEPKWFEDEPVYFASGDEGVFTVDKQGRITAVSIGEADLSIKAKDFTKTVRISVVPKVSSIKGIDKTYSLITGSSSDLEPELIPAEFSDEKITYSVSDDTIAKVDESGLVTALKAGETKVTVSAGGSSISTDITVSDPVPVYTAPSSRKTSGSAKSSGKKKSTGSSAKKKSSSGSAKKSSASSGGSSKSSGSGSKSDYFESSDDEFF